MTDTVTNKPFKLKLELALLEALHKKGKELRGKKQTLNPAVWSAIVAQVRNYVFVDEWEEFLAEVGYEHNFAYQWGDGKKLPSPKMCAFYCDIFLEKIEGKRTRLTDEITELDKPPKAEQKSKAKSEDKADLNWFVDWKIEKLNLPDGITAEMALEELPGYQELGTRLRTSLKNENIQTVGQLVDLSSRYERNNGWMSEILRIPNLGRKSVNELVAFLKELGFTPIYE